MNFINMLAPWQWLLVGLVPPAIIALYYLKLKRQPLEVPSTYLWHKSIEDLHVNSIWQRLRKNLLLFLQLLVLLMVAIALLRPSWRDTALAGDRFIFLIDNSASMSATDISPTRLDEAKRQVLELIDQMKAGDQAMVVSFADNAQVMQEFTDNRRRLRERVAAIRATHRPTDLLGALKLVSGMANRELTTSYTAEEKVDESVPADLLIFSDGKFVDVVGFSLGALEPIYIPIGQKDVGNVGIVAFSAQRKENRPAEVQAIAQVENFGAKPVDISLGLYMDGVAGAIDAADETIPPGDSVGVVFELGEVESGGFRLQIETEDALPVDNAAFATVAVPRQGRVLLVTPGNGPLERALATPRVQELANVQTCAPGDYAKKFAAVAASAGYDLVIFDQQTPKDLKMPQANTLFIGCLPPEEKWKPSETAKIAQPQITDTEQAHPIMQLIDLGDVAIDQSFALPDVPGGTVLIDSTGGRLFELAPRQGFEDAVLGFEIYGTTEQGERYANTNWVIRQSFPTFVFHLVQYLAGQHALSGIGSARPGDVVRLKSVSQIDELEVRDPRRRSHTVPRGPSNEFSYSGTEQTGFYEVFEADQAVQQFAVNLFDSSESNIAPRPENTIQIGYVDVEGREAWEPARQETWKWLLVLVLAVLLLEWYIYNRRVYL
jgi:hypothetical protein